MLPIIWRSIALNTSLLLISCFSLQLTSAQGPALVLAKAAPIHASRLDLLTSAGLNLRPSLPIDLGLRIGLGQQAALDFTLGTPQWGQRDATHGQGVPGGSLRKLRLDAGVLASATLKGYTQPGRSGLYAGVAVGLQSYKVTSETRFKNESLGIGETAASSNNVGVGILGILFGALLESSNHSTFTRTTSGTATSVQLQAGYAFAFGYGQRLEVGGRMIARSLSNNTFALGTPTRNRVLDIPTAFETTTWGVEARYVLPLMK